MDHHIQGENSKESAILIVQLLELRKFAELGWDGAIQPIPGEVPDRAVMSE